MKKIIFKTVIGLVILAIGIVSYLVIQNIRFRVVDSSPAGKVFPTSSRELKLVFNKELDMSSVDNSQSFQVNPAVTFSQRAEGKTLYIILNQLPSGKKIDFIINNLRSVNGQTISIKKTFKIDYVSYNKLSEYEQQQQIKQTNQEEDIYPIIQIMPVIKSGYTIDYELPSKKDGKLFLIIDAVGVNDDKKYYGGSMSYLENIRKEAIEFIKSSGFNPEDYIIKYAENF